MTHAAAIIAAERALLRWGVAPATAADAARSAWLAAWERGGCVDGAPGTSGRTLLLAARRLCVAGRGGASRAVAPLPSAPEDLAGGDVAPALDDLLDLAAVVGRSPRAAVLACRAAGASLADVGAACGVSGEAARKWATGATEPCSEALRRLHAYLAPMGT